MTGRSKKPVQTPGQAPAAASQDNSTTAAPSNSGDGSQLAESSQQQAGAMGHPDAASVGGDQTGDTGGGEDTVTIPKATLDILLARVEALEGAAQNKIAKGAGVQRQRLPDQEDIDPTKITQPQLTEQGWVLPINFGSNPNGNKI
jgi:hypothetical protein